MALQKEDEGVDVGGAEPQKGDGVEALHLFYFVKYIVEKCCCLYYLGAQRLQCFQISSANQKSWSTISSTGFKVLCWLWQPFNGLFYLTVYLFYLHVHCA